MFIHKTVNHSENFIDPITGAETNYKNSLETRQNKYNIKTHGATNILPSQQRRMVALVIKTNRRLVQIIPRSQNFNLKEEIKQYIKTISTAITHTINVINVQRWTPRR